MELKDKLEALKSMDYEARYAQLHELAKEHTTKEDRAAIQEFMDGSLDEISQEIDELDAKLDRMALIKSQINSIREIIPLQYIAKTYFGKSAAWLSQRINGNEVRGKIYALKEEEIATLNMAIKDIGKQLGSLTIG